VKKAIPAAVVRVRCFHCGADNQLYVPKSVMKSNERVACTTCGRSFEARDALRVAIEEDANRRGIEPPRKGAK
jgi:transposase-like protein